MDINTSLIGRSLVASARFGIPGLANKNLNGSELDNMSVSTDLDSDKDSSPSLTNESDSDADPTDFIEHAPSKSNIADCHWYRRWNKRTQGLSLSGSRLGPAAWLRELRALKQRSSRVLTVLHLFGGKRRKGDIEEHTARLARERGLEVHFTTIDLETSPEWDLACPTTFALVM